jgi:hypothetical protein
MFYVLGFEPGPLDNIFVYHWTTDINCVKLIIIYSGMYCLHDKTSMGGTNANKEHKNLVVKGYT